MCFRFGLPQRLHNACLIKLYQLKLLLMLFSILLDTSLFKHKMFKLVGFLVVICLVSSRTFHLTEHEGRSQDVRQSASREDSDNQDSEGGNNHDYYAIRRVTRTTYPRIWKHDAEANADSEDSANHDYLYTYPTYTYPTVIRRTVYPASTISYPTVYRTLYHDEEDMSHDEEDLTHLKKKKTQKPKKPKKAKNANKDAEKSEKKAEKEEKKDEKKNEKEEKKEEKKNEGTVSQ